MIEVGITSLFLGIGLAMDACAVSMANGMKEPNMKLRKTLFISLMFGLFQGLMPLIGFLLGTTFQDIMSLIFQDQSLLLFYYEIRRHFFSASS